MSFLIMPPLEARGESCGDGRVGVDCGVNVGAGIASPPYHEGMAWLFVIALVATPSFASPMRTWQLGDLAKAPVLAVCRVERVTERADVPPGKLRWRTATREMQARLTVLRSLPVLRNETIVLNYYGYGKVHGLTAGDAQWPRLSPGDIKVFPLVRVSGRWRLAMEEGVNNTMPAIAPPRPEAPSRAGYDFLIGELVNSLSWGQYRELNQTALFLRESGWSSVLASLMPLLRQNIASDWGRWADIAASSLGASGIRRKPLAEIRAARPPHSLATLALSQLAERNYEALVIQRMIARSDVHEWGSAVTLQEFAEHPLVLRLMPDRLRSGAPGALYVASWVIQADPQSPLLAGALDASLDAFANARCSRNDRYAAANLIVDHGSEAQFAALLDQFRRFQRSDPKLYYEIFSAVESRERPRVARICAAMLVDQRVLFGERRYCDLAGARLQALSKEKFGFGA